MIAKSQIAVLSDEELVQGFLKTQANIYFEELYDRFSDKVYGKCIGMLKNEAKAADATQDIFIKLMLNLSKFNQGSRFSSWIYSITYNFCIDVIRKSKKVKIQELEDYDAFSDGSQFDEISDAAILEIRANELSDILEKIKVEEKMILLLKYQDGVSIREMANLLDLSESAVKMRLKRAKEKVVNLRNEFYGSNAKR